MCLKSKNKEIKKYVINSFYNYERIVEQYKEYENIFRQKIIYIEQHKQLNQKLETNKNFNKEYNMVQKKYNKGFLYIASSFSYLKRNLIKIGYTNDLAKRLPTQNTSNINEDNQFYICTFELHTFIDHKAFEKEIHRLLEKFRVSDNKEFFKIKFSVVLDVIQVLILMKKKLSQDLEILVNSYLDNLKNSDVSIYTAEDKIQYVQNIFSDTSVNNSINKENKEIINKSLCNRILSILIKNLTYVFSKRDINMTVISEIENYLFNYPDIKNIIDREFVISILENCGGFKYVKNRYVITEDELENKNIIINIK